MTKITHRALIRRERELHLGLALTIGCALWIVPMFFLSAWVNYDPTYWENLTRSWGYAEFRLWGDPIFFGSLFVIPAAIIVIYVILRFSARHRR